MQIELEGDEFVVEAILKSRRSRKKRGGMEYLVRWQGYDEEDDSWEPEGSLSCKV
jgi:hypothetical protein